MEKVIFTEKELSTQFGLPQRALATMRKKGFISGVRVGRHWIYPKDEVDAFFERFLGEKISTK